MTRARTFRTEQFADYLAFERGLSDRTVRAYCRDLDRLLGFLEERGVPGPEGVAPSHVREHVFALKDAGLAATSIRRALSSVRAYFGFLLSEGVLTADPSERIESPRVGRTLPGVLSVHEVERLLEAPSPDRRLYWRDRAILEVLYATGVRVSELVSLELSRLDLPEGLCTVLGKGSKERMTPVGRTAREVLHRYLAEVRPRLETGEGAGRVFLSARGRPLTRMTIWSVVARAAVAAGLDRAVSPHTLRHTCATHLLQGGADLAAVQELLGHEDISTTQIYTHVDREYLKDVHRRYHPRG